MMKIKKFILIYLVFLWQLINLHYESLALGKFSNPRSTGLAGAYIGLARGTDASSWNPANLGLSAENRGSINLLCFGVELYNNSFSLGQYNQYNGSSLHQKTSMKF
jgi:hypothetical protein